MGVDGAEVPRFIVQALVAREEHQGRCIVSLADGLGDHHFELLNTLGTFLSLGFVSHD